MINIVLFEPEKPANTGNILRTAMATNSTVHVIKPSFSMEEKDFKRAGMDYVKQAKFFVYSSYEEFDKKFHDKKIFYVTRYGKHVYSEFDFSNPVDDIFIMFGKESTGIDKKILKDHLDSTLRIPMISDARSLNLSNCVALVLYEILRQQKFPGLSSFEMIKHNVLD